MSTPRSLGRFVRPYTESFSIYGSEGSFEWPQLEHDGGPLVYELGKAEPGRGRQVIVNRPAIDDNPVGLPEPVARYTQRHLRAGANGQTFPQGGGHGGSHPYLAHEFISAIAERRPAAIDDVRAAQWTAPGIAAHLSAVRGGVPVDIPSFQD